MTGNHEQAKDLTHDTFIKAFDRIESYEGGNEKYWLCRIARHICIDYHRRKKMKYPLDSFKELLKTNDNLPEQIVILDEASQQLYKALKKLKKSYQEVILLRKIQGLSIEETSKLLGWNESKVKVTLHRSLKALKVQLKKEGFSYERI